MSSLDKIYRLQNKKTGDYWCTGKGRCDFYSVGSLRGATKTSYAPWGRWPDAPQKGDFEVVEFAVTEICRKEVDW